MKKKSTYFFGYLFVRFAKILALLVLIGGSVAISAWTYNYVSAASGIKYEKDISLDRKLNQLENSSEFTTKEVGRITSVADLKPIILDEAPIDLKGFDKVSADLVIVDKRGIELKRRLIDDLETKAAKLEGELVKFLEKRSPTSPTDRSLPTSKTATTSAPPLESSQSIFGESSDEHVESARLTLKQIGDFYLNLERVAEKAENRRLLHETYEEIDRLLGWLPEEIKSAASEPQIQTPNTEQVPAVNPFVRVQMTLNQIRKSIQLVRSNVTQGWDINQRLDDTIAQLDAQRVLFRSSITEKNALRTAWVRDVGLTLFLTLLLAFAVLVGADWLQSFFDTATCAGKIQVLLEGIAGEDGSRRL